MVRLVPREGEPPRSAVAVTWSGYLVIASSVDDLAGLGAYAARTLPTKRSVTSSFEMRVHPPAFARAGQGAQGFAAAGATIVASVARELLPAEVDANAVAACFTPGIRDLAAAAADLREARVDIDADGDQLSAVATLVPKPGDNGARRRFAAMHPAEATPLGDAPSDAMATVFLSESGQARAEDAGALGPCLGRALAPILGPGGGERLAELLNQWARGRGDWETASLFVRPGMGGVVLRAAVSEPGVAFGALRGFADLAAQPAASEAIRRALPHRAGQVQSVDVPPVGKASLLIFPPHAPASRGDVEGSGASAELSPPGVAWAVDGKEADVAVGQPPRELLARARSAAALRTKATTDRAIQGFGADAVFAAIVVPPGCCTTEAPGAAPVALSWGRRGDDGRATLVAGDAVLGRLLVGSLFP
jgi:hypothetical protein